MPRQQTLKAVFEVLRFAERTGTPVPAAPVRFSGGWDLEAAEAVCEGEGITAASA